ncbi:MAG: hypothetical protein IKK29_06735 [Christensenellaceae bacterium]|nr:hypothetical protein [Christensenellaceae bacterium]
MEGQNNNTAPKKKSSGIWLILLILFAISRITFSSDGPELVKKFDEENFIEEIEQRVEYQGEYFEFICRGSGLDEKIDAAAENAFNKYLVNKNVETINWEIKNAFLKKKVIITIDYKQTGFYDDRYSAIEYSAENLKKGLTDCIISGQNAKILLTNTGGYLTENDIRSEINKLQMESGLISYYLRTFSTAIYVYSDYIEVELITNFSPDLVPYYQITCADYNNFYGAIQGIDDQWDYNKTAVIYYPNGIGENIGSYVNKLVLAGVANDEDDPYICENYNTFYYGTKDILVTISKEYIDYDYETQQKQRAKLMKEAQKIVDSLKGDTPEEKVIEIGKKLASRVKYNYPLCDRVYAGNISAKDNINRSAYGALIQGNTVCSGYAKAFKLLCNLAGIECWNIYTMYDGNAHELNVVCTNGIWHYTDITFADNGNKKCYKFGEDYFNQLGHTHYPEFVHPYQ